ncbi:cupin domain-containing protein [Dehalobacter sp. DCM]|uniref:helix-turn-helix domain-containing protein n=1 Tax=Dehalobacter sp. DCM TaxID=2907827 RepID=UPI0030817547|nr:cupin domain-containing protein [Dehalobacter sp. DCM]
MVEIGPIIRDIRKTKQLSLRNIAERTDLTMGYLSLVERNKVSPSLSSIEKIAGAMSIPVSSLFPRPKIQTQYIPKERRTHLHHSLGGLLEYLCNPTPSSSLCVYITKIHALESMIFQHEGTELIYVLHGELHLYVGTEEYVMREGDAILFNASAPHWGVPCDDKLEMIVACTSINNCHLFSEKSTR